MIKILLACCMLLTLVACHHVVNDQPQTASIYNLQGEAVYEINANDTLAQLEQAFINKTPTTVKIYPVFAHTITLTINNKPETWFINAAGYTQQQSFDAGGAGNAATLHRITLPTVIRDFLRTN